MSIHLLYLYLIYSWFMLSLQLNVLDRRYEDLVILAISLGCFFMAHQAIKRRYMKLFFLAEILATGLVIYYFCLSLETITSLVQVLFSLSRPEPITPKLFSLAKL